MMNTFRAVVREGRIEPLKPADLPEGEAVMAPRSTEESPDFREGVGRSPLDAIWDNVEDDAYAQLLKD